MQPKEELLIELGDTGLDDLKRLYSHFDRVEEVDIKCQEILEDQKYINEKLQEIISLQNCCAHFVKEFGEKY